jgi:hypothetical protein
MNRTKMVCTIGPATDSLEALTQLADNGMNMCGAGVGAGGGVAWVGDRVRGVRLRVGIGKSGVDGSAVSRWRARQKAVVEARAWAPRGRVCGARCGELAQAIARVARGSRLPPTRLSPCRRRQPLLSAPRPLIPNPPTHPPPQPMPPAAHA